jgi:branched-chain amino acid transport system substrate-binding protein
MRRAVRLLCLPLLAAGVQGAQPALAQSVEIGLAVPLTGPFAALGHQLRAGAQAAVDQINRNGGVLRGRRLMLRFADDGCDHLRAAAVARSLSARKIPVVIGHVCASASLAAAPIYGATGILLMSPATVDPLLAETMWARGRPNVYRIGGGAEQQGMAAALYLGRRFEKQEITLVRDQTTYGRTLARGVLRGLAKMGVTSPVQAFDGDLANVDAAIDRMDQPAAVFVAGSARNAARFIKRAKERGLDAVFAVGDAGLSREFLGVAENDAEGVLSTSPLDARPLASAQDAVTLLRERGVEPEGHTLYAFAAVQVIAQAIDRSGTTDFTRMKRVLDTRRFGSVFGEIRFVEGEANMPLVGFLQWRDGRPESFDSRPYWDFARDGAIASREATTPFIVLLNKKEGGVDELAKKAAKEPRARDTTTPLSRPAARALQGVFWNTYFTREGEPDARPRAGSTASYTLVLDLSAYNYRQITDTNAVGAAVDPRVRRHLDTAPQEPVELKIRPVMVTPEFILDDAPVKPLPVERGKLVRHRDGTATRVEEHLIRSFREGDLKVGEFSAKVAAGRVAFQVKLAENAVAGCAVIAFTIWDIHDNPLDHLLRTVAIDGSKRTDCAQEGLGTEALKGGFATFLSPVFSIGPGDATQPIHAALHVFETMAPGNKKKSIAILVDKSRGAAQPPGRANDEPGVYSWRMAHWLSDYIGNDLPFQLNAGWDAADNGRPQPYARAANELATFIFGAELADKPKAEAAKTALRRIADATSAPVVLARLIGSENRKLYMPLGLIAAAGNSEGLSKPITIVQPLAVERYGQQRCIQAWSVAMSSNTTELDPKLKPDLETLAAGGKDNGEEWYPTQDALRQYLAMGTEPPMATAPGQGLVLLAHHDNVGMYFNDRPGRISANGFQRRYPFGSVALLASCTTGNPTSDMAILDRLNEHGIDAAIVSPFKVRLKYAARLAYEFTQIVRSSRRERLTPTLADVFAQAGAKTTEYFMEQRPTDTPLDPRLEFVLVGNPYLRLCAP